MHNQHQTGRIMLVMKHFHGSVDFIRAELAARRWSASDLARRAGLTQSKMSRVLSESSSMKVEDLDSIIDALGLDLSQFAQKLARSRGDDLQVGGNFRRPQAILDEIAESRGEQGGGVKTETLAAIYRAMELMLEDLEGRR